MVEWIKKHKAATLLIVVGIWFFYNLIQSFMGVNLLSLSVPQNSVSYGGGGSGTAGISGPSLGSYGSSGSVAKLANPSSYGSSSRSYDYAPQNESGNRMVVQESNISLQVKSVVDTRNKIIDYANSKGGYMVTSSTSNPQDVAFANVTIRIPADKMQEALDYFQNLSIKVVSENLTGYDVTDQYVDTERRLKQLENTQKKLEAILDNATQISDITNLTQQIINYQNQIDGLKGQQQSLEQNAKLAKLTIYLSTDDLALPYSPNETFRPLVTFKLAVRSLVRSLRNIANLTIWLTVYSVIWIPVVLLIWYIRKRIRSKSGPSKPLPN